MKYQVIGSILTVISILLLLWIIYDQLSSKRIYINNNVTYKHYSIETLLTYPPKYHHFKELPIC